MNYRPTMPLSNLFKNCAYYWTFGAVIGIPLCSVNYAAPSNVNLVYGGLVLFAVSQLGNLICHIMLSRLRKAEGNVLNTFVHSLLNFYGLRFTRKTYSDWIPI